MRSLITIALFVLAGCRERQVIIQPQTRKHKRKVIVYHRVTELYFSAAIPEADKSKTDQYNKQARFFGCKTTWVGLEKRGYPVFMFALAV